MSLRLTFAGALILLLAACAGAPVVPPRLLAAIEANNHAAAALARADYVQAERLYLQALAHDRAIENGDGVAINLIGLAVTYQKAGHPDEALRVAAQVAAADIPGVPAERLAEADLLQATVLLARADWDGAERLVDQAQAVCAQMQPPCRIGGRLANVQGQLAIVNGRPQQAAAYAQLSIAAAEVANDQEELANALRLAGNAKLLDQPAEGIDLVSRALAIDKRLALSGKIYRDLVLLGRLYATAGQRVQARQMYVRARAVAEADKAGTEEVAQMESQLGE